MKREIFIPWCQWHFQCKDFINTCFEVWRLKLKVFVYRISYSLHVIEDTRDRQCDWSSSSSLRPSQWNESQNELTLHACTFVHVHCVSVSHKTWNFTDIIFSCFKMLAWINFCIHLFNCMCASTQNFLVYLILHTCTIVKNVFANFSRFTAVSKTKYLATE